MGGDALETCGPDRVAAMGCVDEEPSGSGAHAGVPQAPAMLCHRCNVEMVDDGEWFICPCCRIRTRGRERQQAIFEKRMAELGMNEEEYTEYCGRHISKEPIPRAVLEKSLARMAARWEPACEHDTENPFLPKQGGA